MPASGPGSTSMKGCPGVARRTTSGGTSAPHWTSPTGSAAAVARLRTVINGSRSVLLGTLHEHAQARQWIAQITDTSWAVRDAFIHHREMQLDLDWTRQGERDG